MKAKVLFRRYLAFHRTDVNETSYLVLYAHGVKGIVAGFVPRSGHRRVVMASSRAEPGLGRFGTWSGSSLRGDGSGLASNAVIFSPGVMDVLHSLSSPKAVCAW